MNRKELLDYQENLCHSARALMARKNEDYTAGDKNILGNLAMCEGISHGDVLTEQGIILRMGDKLCRAWTLTKGEGAVANEPMHDVCLDLINYAVLLQVAHQQRRNDRPSQEICDEAKTAGDITSLTATEKVELDQLITCGQSFTGAYDIIMNHRRSTGE